MKILQVIDTLNIGGAERVFVDMCNILHENADAVTAFLLLENKGELASQLKVPVIQLNRKNKWSLKTMYRCSKILKDAAIIHCHLRHVYSYISFVNFIFRCKSKIVFHDHYGSIDVDKRIPFLLNTVFKPKYYIGVSDSLLQWSFDHLKISENNAFLLPNIIRKKKYNVLIEKDLNLILVSNIKPIKNNLFAVEIAKELRRKLLLVGKIQDEAYFTEIQNNLDEQICLNTAITDAQAVAKAAKMGLHTSKSETGPLVLIEYLAQGLPFLAYETGEVAKILKPHFPEFFIDNFELEQWKARIDIIAAKKPDEDRMDAIFEQFFGEKQYHQKLINIYKCISDY